jgi:large subunit ribosomal protein L9
MKVILNADVENLGEEGDICDVKDGYGRNYLLPKQLALPYNKPTLALFEQKRDAIEKRKEEKREAAQSLKERIEEEPLVIRRPAGETGKLFGSVTAATLVEELEKRGLQIEKKRIELHQHNIKMVGNYSAKIKLYNEESANLTFSVESADSKSGSEPVEEKPAAQEAADDTAAAQETAAAEPAQAPERAAEEPEKAPDQAAEEAAAAQAAEEAAEVVEKTVTEQVEAAETTAEQAAGEDAGPEERAVETESAAEEQEPEEPEEDKTE